MTKKVKNQHSKDQNPENKNKEQLDIVCLAKLQESLEQASKLLADIFARLCIDLDRMAKIKGSLEYNPPKGVWKLKQAQDYLDAIIISAAFGRRSIVENNGVLVQISAMTEKGEGDRKSK